LNELRSSHFAKQPQSRWTHDLVTDYSWELISTDRTPRKDWSMKRTNYTES